MRLWKCALLGLIISASSASQTNSQGWTGDQLKMVADHAHMVCETVKEARGKKTEGQLQADVQAKAGGLWKLIDLGGGVKGTIDRETFEGLSREATGALLEGDRNCRERLVSMLLRAMLSAPQTPPASQIRSAPEMRSVPAAQSTPQVKSDSQRCDITSDAKPESFSREFRCCNYGSGACKTYLSPPFELNKPAGQVIRACICLGAGGLEGKIGVWTQ